MRLLQTEEKVFYGIYKHRKINTATHARRCQFCQTARKLNETTPLGRITDMEYVRLIYFSINHTLPLLQYTQS